MDIGQPIKRYTVVPTRNPVVAPEPARPALPERQPAKYPAPVEPQKAA